MAETKVPPQRAVFLSFIYPDFPNDKSVGQGAQPLNLQFVPIRIFSKVYHLIGICLKIIELKVVPAQQIRKSSRKMVVLRRKVPSELIPTVKDSPVKPPAGKVE
jgi:hypothetical protein